MKKLIALCITLLLAGCTELMNGLIQNRSDNPILIYWQDDNRSSYKIASNQDLEIHWVQGCVTIVESEVIKFFDSSEIPSDYIINRMFSSSIDILYRNRQLSYVTSYGDKEDLPILISCQNE